MATVLFEGRNDNLVNLDLLGYDASGIVINYANILGWPQGFDGQPPEVIPWQINEAGLEPLRQNKTDGFWVQFSIPENPGSKAPFAGIASVMDGVASRLNWERTDSYSFAIDTEHINVQSPEGSSVFERFSRDNGTQARISISVPLGPHLAFHKNALNPPNFGLEYLINDATILDCKNPVRNSIIPEYQDTAWRDITVFDSFLREWSPVAAGVLAGTLAFMLAENNIKCNILIQIVKLPSTAPRC